MFTYIVGGWIERNVETSTRESYDYAFQTNRHIKYKKKQISGAVHKQVTFFCDWKVYWPWTFCIKHEATEQDEIIILASLLYTELDIMDR